MKIIKSLVLISSIMTVDLYSKAVSFSVRNLSGAPIVGGVWKWGYTEWLNQNSEYKQIDANIQGATPIASGELKGWAWDDQAPKCNKETMLIGADKCVNYSTMHIALVNFVWQKSDPITHQLVNNSSELSERFEGNWDFALLPGGKIIKLRNYGDSYEDLLGRYVHPNFETLYRGQIQEIVTVPKVILDDGKTIVGTVKEKENPSVDYHQITIGKRNYSSGIRETVAGALKQYIPGKIILDDNSTIDWSRIADIRTLEPTMEEEAAPDNSDKLFIIMKQGNPKKFSDIKQYVPGTIIMADGKQYTGELLQQIPATIIMSDGKRYQNVKQIIPAKVQFADGTVVLADGTVTK